MTNEFKKFAKLKRLLRQAYPKYDVRIRRCLIPEGWEGKCWKDGKVFRIHIAKHLEEAAACETLFHEFAHVPAWSEYVKSGEHGEIWGKHYGRCYTIWEQNFLSD